MSNGGSRANSTFTGYAIVLGAIVLIVAGMALVVNARQQEHIPSVDYTTDAVLLSEIAPYQTYVPEGLPEGWIPTSSRLETGGTLPGEEPTGPIRWTLGFATPNDRHAAFSISDADPEKFIAEVSRNGAPEGESTVDGQTWEQLYNAAESERSLVRRADDATLIISGGASYEELETLAGALEEQEPPSA